MKKSRKEEGRIKVLRALQNRNKNGDEFVALIRSTPASLSAALAALPCMSLIPVAPFLPDNKLEDQKAEVDS